jgi:hypothetical protein
MPIASVALPGDSWMEVRVFATVTLADPETPDRVAVMLAVPAAMPLAKPDAETVATLVLEEDQVAVDATSFVDPSLYVPVASNCWLTPAVNVADFGVTATEERLGAAGGELVLPLPPPQPETIAARSNPKIKRPCIVHPFSIHCPTLEICDMTSRYYISKRTSMKKSDIAGIGHGHIPRGQESPRQ